MRLGGHGASAAPGKLWRVVALTAAGTVGGALHAEAALYYWSNPDSGYYYPVPMIAQQRLKPRHRQVKQVRAPDKESSKPQGPLIIAISIERQNLKIYDAKGIFAEAPISTGMKGHPTPMGVFSVIQKHKLHHSNIYSGAPMPYMQRITWSGVAIHGGVLPGYPASHGCIRMPMAFAVKMWNWTKLGARVVVTPGEIKPASFSHPLLMTRRVMPQPAEPQADAPAAIIAPLMKIGASDDANKDHAGLPEPENAIASKPDPALRRAPTRSGQIAAFISGKDSKLYVRQNFAPLFETPIAIAPSDRPLGTHVFTAEVDKDDPNVLHWSVVSLPANRHAVRRNYYDERLLRRQRIARVGTFEVKALVVPDGPAEALDRLTIPADAIAGIAEALSTGGSIIVSDQGIAAGETGEGTDFIVSLR